MSTQVSISHIGAHVGREVVVRGWIAQKRSSGKLQFIVLRDGSGLLQTVVGKNDCDPATWEALDRAGLESSLIVTGTPREEKRAPGGYELGFKSATVVQSVGDWPLQKKEHGPDFLMDHRHLWLRASKQVATLRVRNELIFGLRDFFYRQGFINIDSPIITPAACEGTSTLFELDYHGEPAFLSQSGQLYIEPAAMAHGKVYCFGPTFRAEKSKTRRHLHEFWMLEPEVAWADLDDIMNLAEAMLVDVIGRVLDKCKEEFKTLERDTAMLEKIQAPFPRVSYTDAVKKVNELGLEMPWGDDFGAAQETKFADQFDRPVMVHRYPASVKAFYMQPDETDPRLAKCVDVLAPEGYGEIIGGSQRIHDHDLLLKRIEEHKLPVSAFQWYLDIRKYGSVPHSGFGLGLERLVAWVCKLDHVRETIPYARTLYRLYP